MQRSKAEAVTLISSATYAECAVEMEPGPSKNFRFGRFQLSKSVPVGVYRKAIS